MYWALYQTIVALSAGACAALWHLRPVRPVFGMAGAGGWIIAAFQARNIIVYHQDGTSTTVGSEAWQYVCLGLALLTLATLVMWYLGVYPPQTSEDAGEATIPEPLGE